MTYVVQRTESLMGLCFLTTMYALLRHAESPSPRWASVAIASCALGMGSKEVMVVAPVMALLLDRTLLAGSFRRALALRGRLHAGLFSTWVIFAVLAPGGRSGSVSLSFPDVTPWRYLLTQAGVIAHYLRLSIWPSGLCIDYHDWPLATSPRDVAVPLAAVLCLLGATAGALATRHPVGLAGAWFFLILAPTSSFVPIKTEVAAERRMYLPLAAVVCLSVIAAWRLGHRYRIPKLILGGAAAATAVALGVASSARNRLYVDEVAIWSDTVAVRPANGRALANLATALVAKGRLDEALPVFRRALEHDPGSPLTMSNLGAALLDSGRVDDAIAAHGKAVQMDPGDAVAHFNLARALRIGRRVDEALASFREACRLAPSEPRFASALAVYLAEVGRCDDAISALQAAERLAPGSPELVAARQSCGAR